MIALAAKIAPGERGSSCISQIAMVALREEPWNGKLDGDMIELKEDEDE